MESSDQQRAKHRNKSIKGAIITALMSKVGTMLLRLISIPVAISVLDKELFGVYATVLIVVQMMDVMHVGIGPSLTQKLSKAQLENNKHKEAQLFSTSLIISALCTIVVAMVLWIVVANVPIANLFGENYAAHAATMKRVCFIAIALITIEMIAFIAERARDGYMETRFTNSWGAGGNLLAGVALVVGIKIFPTVEFLILAVNGSVILAKVGNMVQMLWQRPYLLPKRNTFSKKLIKPLLAGAGVFTIVYGFSAVAEYNSVTYFIGRFLGPGEAANWSILVTCHMSLTGMLGMVTLPLWPAIIDAWERGDFTWIKQSAKKMRLMVVAYGLATFFGMMVLGVWAMKLWIGKQFDLDQVALTFFGLYFALHVWRGINQIFCLGMDLQKPVMWIVLTEAFTSMGVAFLLLRAGMGITEILIALCVCLAVFSGWMYPLLYKRAMADGETDAKTRADHEPNIEHSASQKQPKAV